MSQGDGGDIRRIFEEANALFSDGNDAGQFWRSLQHDLQRLGNEPVDIAVTGNTGVGKSSFINAVLG